MASSAARPLHSSPLGDESHVLVETPEDVAALELDDPDRVRLVIKGGEVVKDTDGRS